MNEQVTEGLDQVVEALCRRGIEAGEQEAQALVARARADAEQQRAAARAEAERIVAQAEEQARQRRERLDQELRRAAGAGVLALRRAVEQAVVGAAVDEALAATLSDEPTLAALLVEAVRAFASSGEGDVDLELRLPPALGARLGQALLARAQQVARRGVRVRLDEGLSGGFVLDAAGVQLDFSDEAFREVLTRFVAPRFRRFLARGEEAGR